MGTADTTPTDSDAVRETLGGIAAVKTSLINDAVNSPSSSFYECLPQLVASAIRQELLLLRIAEALEAMEPAEKPAPRAKPASTRGKQATSS